MKRRAIIIGIIAIMLALWAGVSSGGDIEIIDVQMRELQRYEIYGVEISWLVQIMNNTDKPRKVFVKVYFLDADGFKLDDDIQAAVLAPGAVTTVTDTAFIQPEIYAQIKSIKAEF